MLEEIWVKLNLGHKTVGSKTLGPGKSLNGVFVLGCPNGVWKVSGSQGRSSKVGSKNFGSRKSLNGVLWMCSGCPNGVWKVSGSQGR